MLKNFLKKYKIYIIFFLILVVAMPVFIWISYFIGKSVPIIFTDFTAGDILLYIGSILAGIATVAGVFLSIKYMQSNYQQDKIDRVLPYLNISEVIEIKPPEPFLFGWQNSNDEVDKKYNNFLIHKQKKLKRRIEFIKLINGKLANQYILKSEDEFYLESGIKINFKENGHIDCKYEDQQYYLELEITNIGIWPIIHLKLEIGISQIIAEKCFIYYEGLEIGKSVYLGIFLPLNEKLLECFCINVTSFYNDIYLNSYEFVNGFLVELPMLE